MPPPDCAAKPKTLERPRPVPRPTSLVVKNGSLQRFSVEPLWLGVVRQQASQVELGGFRGLEVLSLDRIIYQGLEERFQVAR